MSLNLRNTQDVGKAYNELKQGEPAIERLFQLSSFKSKVCYTLFYFSLTYKNYILQTVFYD